MGDKKDKGRPVNLSDLLKITPVANEILRLSGEMSYSPTDLLWIVGEMMDGSEGITSQDTSPVEEEETQDFRRSSLFFDGSEVEEEEDVWDASDLDDLEAEMEDLAFDTDHEDAIYTVAIKVQGRGNFPDMGFKADIKQKEDLKKFFNMVMEMIERFEV